MPERETPGRRASAWATPMSSASSQVSASRSRSSFATWSIRYMKPAKTISATPIIHGLPSVLVMKSSSRTPANAAGTVLTMRSQARRASGSPRLRLEMLRTQARMSRPISRQK